jgi:hypothetical protein
MDRRDKARRMAGINRTEQRIADAFEAAEKKRRMRRWGWRRRWHAGPYMHPDDKRLRRIARATGTTLPLVEAFVERLDDFASQNTPRGSLEGFSIEDLGAYWSLASDEVLARIYAQLESPDIGWIDHDFIVDFWARNPDVEDTTAAERQARSTGFKKAMEEIARQEKLGLIDEATRTAKETALHALRDKGRHRLMTWAEQKQELRNLLELSTEATTHVVSARESVSITARADQTNIKSGKSVDNLAAGASGDSAKKLSEVKRRQDGGEPAAAGTEPIHSEASETSVDPQAEATLWLSSEGVRIVTERMVEKRTLAELRIARWRDQGLNGDAAALATIIRGAADRGLEGARFHTVVSDGVRRHAEQSANGPQLGLMPPRPTRSERDAAELERAIATLQRQVHRGAVPALKKA